MTEYEYEYGVRYPFDGQVFGLSFDRDEAISELLWALDMRDREESLGYANSVRLFMNPELVVREYDEYDEDGSWALENVTDDELDAARELLGEVD